MLTVFYLAFKSLNSDASKIEIMRMTRTYFVFLLDNTFNISVESKSMKTNTAYM